MIGPERLNALLDRELDEAASADVERAIASDAAARAELDALRRLDAALRDDAAAQPFDVDALARAVRMSIAPKPRRLRPVALAACAFVIGWLLRPMPPLPSVQLQPDQPGIASLERAVGDVALLSETTHGREPLAAGARLREGDELTLGKDGRCIVAFDDGSRLWLDGGSTVAIKAGGVELPSGRAVVRDAPEDAALEVATGDVEVPVADCTLAIDRHAMSGKLSAERFETSLRVLAGSIEVRGRRIEAGYEARFSGGELIGEPRRMEPDELDWWIRLELEQR